MALQVQSTRQSPEEQGKLFKLLFSVIPSLIFLVSTCFIAGIDTIGHLSQLCTTRCVCIPKDIYYRAQKGFTT